MKVGVLAVQGDYEAHAAALAHIGAEAAFIRTVADLEGIDALILPGGESSTQLQFLEEEGLDKAIAKFAKDGGAILGTCAGAILLARKVRNPDQDSLGLADIVVARNGYGRQLASEVREGPSKLSERPLEMVFIRAPIIEEIGRGVEVLAKSDGRPVLVRQGRILAATFHPELTSDSTVHEYLLRLARNGN
ncbi:MAG TPA: pyridoxal 5'-phosphate synthase glutaminase subunit PdxT [Candidatus Acidoferrales bacterium]|nr:pyridoxal 5'-phosphate synthase glutaminase subunit PdxT [Candidatus Acidoferrales bacterium]